MHTTTTTTTTAVADMSSLFVVVACSLCVVVTQDVDAVHLESRAAARRLLSRSLDVAQSLHALHFRLDDPDNRSAVCYVIQRVSDVTVGDDVTQTAW